MNDLETRGPLVFDTRRLVRRPGAMVEIHRDVPAPDHLVTAVVAVPQGETIAFDLRLESVLEGILVSGSARTRAIGACVRCLDDVTVDVDVTFCELFAYADRAAHLHDVGVEDDAEEYVLDGDLLDLEPVLRDAVIPALPFRPLCRDDCPGLCSECGARLADDPTHAHDSIDPRWAALQALASPTPAHRLEEKRN